LQASVSDLAESEVQQELEKHREDSFYYSDLGSLAVLLQRVAEHLTGIDYLLVAEFLEFALDAAVMAGAGRSFTMNEDFLSAADRIIELLAEHGRPISDLLLAKARYHAVLDDRGKSRGEAIIQAIEVSTTVSESTRAMLTLAKYYIDHSKYRKARKVVRRCSEMLAGSEHQEIHQPDLLVTTGISYFFTDINRSESYFTAALREGASYADEPDVQSAVATAYHYIGRILAARDEYKDALESYVTGQKYSPQRLASTGWYHLRMADVLLDCNSLEDAFYHLEQARKIFEQGQVISSGNVVLGSTDSRYHVMIGQPDSANEILEKAAVRAREDRYPRGELICLIQLMRSRFRQKRYLSCLAAAKRAVWVFIHSEAESGFSALPSQLRTGSLIAYRILRSWSSNGGVTRTDVSVWCPCGDNHTISWSRATGQ
jgi:tetratricopeptide (TPR) repeat protein